MDTLEDSYYGNLFPHEKCAKLDDGMKELLSLFNRNEGKLPVPFPTNRKKLLKNTRTAIGKFLKSANGNPLSQDLNLVQRLSLNQ